MTTQTHSKFQGLIAATLIGAIFVLSVVTANDYGVSWDEPIDLYVAERSLRYALTLNPAWIDPSVPVSFAVEGKHAYLLPGLPPWRLLFFGNFLSSIGCYLFFEKLGLMSSTEAHHFPNKLLFVSLLIVVFVFVRRNFNIYTALAVVPAIAFQPRFWADMQFNLKDFPYACFVAFTLICARNAVLKYSWKGAILSAALLGLAAATKPNAALIAVILAVWFIFGRSQMAEVGSRAKKLFWVTVALSPLIAFSVYVLVWPYLWTDPIDHFLNFLNYYSGLSTQGPGYFQFDKILLFLSVQPPAVLLFAAIGIMLSVREIAIGTRRELNVLLLLWLFLPVLRVTLPGVYDYDGVRHFIEYSVPLGILTGWGFVSFCSRFHKIFSNHVPQKAAIGLVAIIASLLPAGWAYTMCKIHPYEIAYFNFLVGGTKGAQQRWSTATDYWGSSYRDGMKWLNQHTEHGALLSVPVGTHIVYSTKDMWLRDDIIFLRSYRERFNPESLEILNRFYKNPQEPLYVMYITRRDWYTNMVRLLESREKPVYQITVEGAPILKIYKINSMDETMAKTMGLINPNESNNEKISP